MKYGITLNMIVDDILNDKNGGMPNDDYAREQIMFKIFRWRELLIRRDVERNGINPIFQQEIGCLELELTNEIICCTAQTDCKVLKSTLEIPQLIRIKGRHAFTVTSTDGDSVFAAMRHTEVRSLPNLRFTGDVKRSYLKPDNYLYVLKDKFTRYVNFTALFYDPRQAARFTTCSGDSCYTNDTAFPISGDFVNAIYQEIAKELKMVNIYEAENEKTKSVDAVEQG